VNRICLGAACLATICTAMAAGAEVTFDEHFQEMKKTATKQELYSLMWALPKGGDLHNHFVQTFAAHQWYEFATDPKHNRGNRFFTRLRFLACPGNDGQFLQFRTIQRSTYEKLPACDKGEYETLEALSPELKAEWISSLKLDKPGEGRNEFFEVVGRRRGELANDPNLVLDLMVENLKLMKSENMRYLETQARPNFQDQQGNPIPEDRVVEMLQERLKSPEAVATGITVRFLTGITRYAPDAEMQVEQAYDFLSRHKDLYVGMNMAGREDNDKGYPSRFMDVHRRMRRIYPGVHLAFHGGEVDSPGEDVRKTLMLGAERIGHGVNLITDPDTMLYMRYNRYLVEINLISNNLLEYVPDLAKHPFPEYLRLGIPVCLNTDDPGAWDSNMADEYFTGVTNFNLTWREIVQIGRNSLQYSFVQEPVKAKLLKDYEEAVHQFEAQYAGENWRKLASAVHTTPSGYAVRTLGIASR
jgi:adenosine deaminase CECR1